MVTKLSQASKNKLDKQGIRAILARAHKQPCHAVAFNGMDPGEYVLMDPPEQLRWKEDGFDWELVHSSAWIDDQTSHYYRIHRIRESIRVVLFMVE